MKKTMILLALTCFVFYVLFMGGCSTGSPSISSPEMPETNTPDDVSGDWAGTWNSSGGSPNGAIDPLTLTQFDNGNGTYSLTGTMKITGMDNAGSGDVSGTLAGSTINFTVTFENGPTVIYQGIKDASITGTYTRYDDGQITDSGNFFLSRK